MSYAQKSDRFLMKQSNQHLVLQLIQSQGPISRKAIAQLSGLSQASVSGITGELIERGLVIEVGEVQGEGRTGRKEVLLRLNAQAGYVVGVKLAVRTIACVLVDLDANVLHATETPLPFVDLDRETLNALAANDFIQATIQAVEELLSIAQIERSRLLGIGIGINGLVDANTGVSLMAPHFGWHNVQLARPLTAHFGIPVLLENDVRALTIAEQWFGAGRGVDHFVTVVAGYGIGAGVVANGQLYRGALSGAGEFGHIVIQPDGLPCTCGKRGCIETLAAERAILHAVQEACAGGEASLLVGQQSPTLETVARAADTGDALAQRVLATAGHWFGVGIANVVSILNPQLLIIKGEVVTCGRWYFEPMEAALRSHTLSNFTDTLRILVEPGGNEVWAHGAACIVLSALFSSPTQQQMSEPVRAVRAMALA